MYTTKNVVLLLAKVIIVKDNDVNLYESDLE